MSASMGSASNSRQSSQQDGHFHPVTVEHVPQQELPAKPGSRNLGTRQMRDFRKMVTTSNISSIGEEYKIEPDPECSALVPKIHSGTNMGL